MNRTLALLAFCAFGVTTLLAQQHGADADKMQGAGSLPAGWSVRLDSGATKPDGVSVVPMGGGIHFKSGPAGIYYRSADTKSGSYEVHASFNQVEPAEHPEAYGLLVGGSNLAGAAQKYTYFLVRQDGMFMISRRDGAKVVGRPAALERVDVARQINAGGRDEVHNAIGNLELGIGNAYEFRILNS